MNIICIQMARNAAVLFIFELNHKSCESAVCVLAKQTLCNLNLYYTVLMSDIVIVFNALCIILFAITTDDGMF